MQDFPPGEGLYAAVIGDVVQSRRSDQSELFGFVEETLAAVNERLVASLPLRSSVGDEFQALYRDVPSALRATLLLSLLAAGRCDFRFGIGWGAVDLIDADRAPAGQSGPAWWEARRAIGETRRTQGWPQGLQTWFASEIRETGLLNAFLICRGQILSQMDPTDAQITLGLLDGRRQVEIGRTLGIAQSAVSARQRTKGPAALLQSQRALENVAREAVS